MGSTSATVLFSGGIDSTSCIHLLQGQGFPVRGLFVDFGQASAAMEGRSVVALGRRLSIDVDQVSARARGEFSTGQLVGRNAFLLFTALLLGRCHHGLLAMGIGIPESGFLSLKRKHLIKVEISKRLDKRPGMSIFLTKVKMFLWDNWPWRKD